MRIITLSLVIFLAQCAHLILADYAQVKSNVKGTMKELKSQISDTMDDIGEKVKDAVEKVVPSCFFGVKSVSMVLFSRDIPYGKVIAANESYTDIDPTKPVVFLSHGFISSANVTNSYMLASELVKKDYIVFSLDWSEGACTNGLPIVKLTGYPSAVGNTREIGDFMASHVMSLIDKCNIPLKNITLIGHSLGAHVCGFASKKIQQAGYGLVPHLFAADPAAPLFLSNTCMNRICITDAQRVTVLHTSELGMPIAVGHVDLYMHYGSSQPGCGLDLVCSHSRAIEYLADILKDNCGFPAVLVSTLDIIIKRKPSYPDSKTTNCIVVTKEIYENDYIKEGKYYVFVNSTAPYCTNQSFNCQQ